MIKESTVSTKYIYDRVYEILDSESHNTSYMLSRLLDELAFNYKIDTGNTIHN